MYGEIGDGLPIKWEGNGEALLPVGLELNGGVEGSLVINGAVHGAIVLRGSFGGDAMISQTAQSTDPENGD